MRRFFAKKGSGAYPIQCVGGQLRRLPRQPGIEPADVDGQRGAQRVLIACNEAASPILKLGARAAAGTQAGEIGSKPRGFAACERNQRAPAHLGGAADHGDSRIGRFRSPCSPPCNTCRGVEDSEPVQGASDSIMLLRSCTLSTTPRRIVCSSTMTSVSRFCSCIVRRASILVELIEIVFFATPVK